MQHLSQTRLLTALLVVIVGASTAVAKADPTASDAGFDALLKEHVTAAGLIDYAAIKSDPARLDAYVASLATAKPDQLSRDEHLTLLINAYNAFTLRLIADHYPINSIKDIPAEARWEAKRWNIGGTIYSLNYIEHEIIRPKFNEPRIHFALVCAAVDCPPLRLEVYRAETLEQQLESQTQYVHTHKRWFELNADTKVLKLTSLYKWFGKDFGADEKAVVQFASRYSPALKLALDKGDSVTVEYLKYDWSLNRQTSP